MRNEIFQDNEIKETIPKAILKSKEDGRNTINPVLMEAMCRGDKEAFESIYLHSVDNLIVFLKILLHNQQDAEEVVQDVFTYLWEHKESIDPKKNFKGYLYTMARNAAFMHIRRRRMGEKYYNHKMNATPDFVESPEDMVISNELRLLINIYVNNMPGQRRRVYELSRVKGKSDAEIASELNISITTVRTHLRLTLGELRRLISLSIILFI